MEFLGGLVVSLFLHAYLVGNGGALFDLALIQEYG